MQRLASRNKLTERTEAETDEGAQQSVAAPVVHVQLHLKARQSAATVTHHICGATWCCCVTVKMTIKAPPSLIYQRRT